MKELIIIDDPINMIYSFLENESILLRSPEPEDIDLMYQIENDTLLWEVGSISVPYSRYHLKQFITTSQNDLFADRQLRLMILSKQENRVIGIIDLSDFDPIHNRAAMGIMVLQQYRKNGFAGKAVGLLKQYCFNHLHIRQLYAHIPVDNEPSISLFRSNGFTPVGILKDWIRGRDNYKDALLAQCINEYH